MTERRTAALDRVDPFANLDFLRGWPLSPFRRQLAHAQDDALGDLQWSPKADIHESDEMYSIGLEVPGIDQNDISVECHENVLTIKGEKTQESKQTRGHCHHVERRFGSFSRSFRLPSDVDEERVRAVHSNGVLTIEIPKIEPTKPKMVAISSGK